MNITNNETQQTKTAKPAKGGMMTSQMKVGGTLLVGLAMIVMVGGCTIAKIGARGAAPIMLNMPIQKVTVIEHVKVSKGIMFDYTNSWDASDILAEVLERTQCDAIVNVGLELRTEVGDFCINACTIGLANAKHMAVTADAVSFPEGLGYEYDESDILAQSDNVQSLIVMLLEMSENEMAQHSIIRHEGGFRLVHTSDG